MSEYLDLGEIILVPVINFDNGIMPVEVVHNGIDIAINEMCHIIDNNFINIIAVDEMSLYMLSDFLKRLPIDTTYSISIMKNYVVSGLSGKINYNKPMVVLHSGIDLNLNDMNLRLFLTMSYMFTKAHYVTLFDHEFSDFALLNNIYASSFTGYGRIDDNNQSLYDIIKYEHTN
mgnify:CR=1 FL=1